MLLRAFCILLWLCSASAHALAGEFNVMNGSIVYSGSVFKGDLARFRAATAAADRSTPIVVNVTAGDFDAAMAIGAMVRKGELTTTTGLERCSDLCSLIWLAGRHRTLPEDSNLDFSSNNADSKTPSTGSIILIQYLTRLELDVPDIAAILAERSGASAGDPRRFIFPFPTAGALAQTVEAPKPSAPAPFRPDYDSYEGTEKDGAPHGTGVLVTRGGAMSIPARSPMADHTD